MRVRSSDSEALLAELKALLASDQLPVQEEVARAAGVHQSLVSRAFNGQLKRVTEKVGALLDYARSRVGAEQRAAAVVEAIDAATVEPPTAEGAAVRTARAARRRGGKAAEAYRREARDGVNNYLDEGYDPRLIIDQLIVLRRAQRLRKSGPLPSGTSSEPTR